MPKKAKTEAEEARKVTEDQRARGKDVVLRWRTAISSFPDLVQTDMHGLLGKFALAPPRYRKRKMSK